MRFAGRIRNIDVNVISRIIKRGLVRAGRWVRMTTTLLDRPGALQSLLAVIADHGANVIQVIHDRVERDLSLGQTFVEVCLETSDPEHSENLRGALARQGFVCNPGPRSPTILQRHASTGFFTRTPSGSRSYNSTSDRWYFTAFRGEPLGEDAEGATVVFWTIQSYYAISTPWTSGVQLQLQAFRRAAVPSMSPRSWIGQPSRRVKVEPPEWAESRGVLRQVPGPWRVHFETGSRVGLAGAPVSKLCYHRAVPEKPPTEPSARGRLPMNRPISLSLALVALFLTALTAHGGPNMGGVIVTHDANLQYCVDDRTECGQGLLPRSCDEIDTNLEGGGDVYKVWKMYAAFPDMSSPRLKGLCWGIQYSMEDARIVGWGNCCGDPDQGALELPDPSWPESGTGTAMVFQFTQTAHLIECYWFAGYNYPGGPSLFELTPHPDPNLGGQFADDSVPAVLDPIMGYGSMGFDREGENPCFPPPPPPWGACCVNCDCYITTLEQCDEYGGQFQGYYVPCDPNNCWEPFGACCLNWVCTVEYPWDCERMGGEFHGECTDCDPTPCPPPNPTENSTWGKIKAKYGR